MKRVMIKNISKNIIITNDSYLANNFFTRLKGLMGKKNMDYDALCIKPCKGVHTFFMRFNINIIYVDKKGRILKIIKNLKPWKVTKFIKESEYIIEIDSKKSKYMKIEVGDELEIKTCK